MLPQYNIYLRNVNKVALFRRVIDREHIKRVGGCGGWVLWVVGGWMGGRRVDGWVIGWLVCSWVVCGLVDGWVVIGRMQCGALKHFSCRVGSL